MEPETTDITGTRKIMITAIVAVMLIVILIGTFVPSAREYVTSSSKFLLSSIPIFLK